MLTLIPGAKKEKYKARARESERNFGERKGTTTKAATRARGALCHVCVFIAGCAGGAIRDRHPPSAANIPRADVSPVLIDIIFSGPFLGMRGKRWFRPPPYLAPFFFSCVYLKTRTLAGDPIVHGGTRFRVSRSIYEQDDECGKLPLHSVPTAPLARSGRSTFLNARGN